MNPAVALWDPVPRSVAVFRALNLGDLLCSIPALRALRRALPQAWIALVGLESARPVVERFPQYVDELLLFPGDAAFPEQTPRPGDLPEFYRRLRARRFDLALQMHGSGARSNEVVRALGARRWAGFVPSPEQQEEGRLMAWPDDQPEIKRYLSLLAYLGVDEGNADLEFPLTRQDHEEADRVARSAAIDPGRTVFVHPGARLASRRWPSDRFAAVANGLAAQGWRIAVTGSGNERPLVDSLLRQLAFPAADLCGATSLGALSSLLQRGRLLICNDTGISHIAAAVGLRSVVIASGSDVRRWAPLDAELHTVIHASAPCRPCAYDECPVGHACALAIGAGQVLAEALRHLEQGSVL